MRKINNTNTQTMQSLSPDTGHSKAKKLRKFLQFSAMFLLFTFLNFYFSNLISHNLAQGWHFSNRFFNIIYVENTGAAFSIMQNSVKFLIILSIIALVAVFYYIIKHLENISIKEILLISLLSAGILGNLTERFFLGFVRDFFELNFINFPVFNISDIFINISVLGIITLILITKKPIKI